MSPTGPSRPHIAQVSPRPTPGRLAQESEEARKRQRKAAKRRTGYASTIMTRGGLGQVQTQKASVLGV